MMEITVLFFATLKDRAGTARTRIELPEGSTVSDLKKNVVLQFPNIDNRLETALVSINQQFAFEEDLVPVGAEVALFPPVSGGSTAYPTIFKVANDPLNLDDLVAQITLESTGAVCIFTGVVRGVTRRGEAHDTAYLEYEAYIPMAEAKMAQVADEIRQQWPVVEGIVIVQRIGRLDAGTPTVIIACAAAHRDTGVFEAAHYGIDRLKEIVPVWKKEVGPQGESWVEGSYIPQRDD
jgi:molybdopterin synthase catalytic subunit